MNFVKSLHHLFQLLANHNFNDVLISLCGSSWFTFDIGRRWFPQLFLLFLHKKYNPVHNMISGFGLETDSTISTRDSAKDCSLSTYALKLHWFVIHRPVAFPREAVTSRWVSSPRFYYSKYHINSTGPHRAVATDFGRLLGVGSSSMTCLMLTYLMGSSNKKDGDN